MTQYPNRDHPSLFDCPTCGARLPVPETDSVECEYCGSVVLVPMTIRPSLTSQSGENSMSVEDPSLLKMEATSSGKHSAAKIVVFFTIFLLLVSFGGIFLFTTGAFIISSRVNTSAEQAKEIWVTVDSYETTIPSFATILPTDLPTATLVPFGEQVLKFGDQGTGPGYFQDPREISVDANGNIFIADFNTGRIQKFDPDGNYIEMIQIKRGDNNLAIISDLATDSNGQLYVVRGGDILIYASGETEPTSILRSQFPQTYYESIAIDTLNNIYALIRSVSSQDLIKINPSGDEVLRVRDIVYGVNPNTPAENRAIAVDGLGNSYFFSTFEPQIYIYNSSGNFVDRLGIPGKEEDQLQNPDKLVVDGKGRIIVLDTGGIKVFDPSGTFIKILRWDYSSGSPRDLVLDRQGFLYLVTSKGYVFKYKLNW